MAFTTVTPFEYRGRNYGIQTMKRTGEIIGIVRYDRIINAMQPHTRRVRIKGSSDKFGVIAAAFKESDRG